MTIDTLKQANKLNNEINKLEGYIDDAKKGLEEQDLEIEIVVNNRTFACIDPADAKTFLIEYVKKAEMKLKEMKEELQQL